tara:strand:+ start:511 stop:630 length:120 start_codon:yes stop_codon:yes gene_type:complete
MWRGARSRKTSLENSEERREKGATQYLYIYNTIFMTLGY